LSGPLRPIMPGYLPHVLGQLMNLLNYWLIDHLRPLDMTPQQFRVLQVLAAKKVANIGELSRDVVVEQSVISRIVDQLEEKGYAFRKRRALNARIVDVRPTPQGNEALRAIEPHARAIVAETMRVLSKREAEHLIEMMERMYRHLGADRRVLTSRPLLQAPTRSA